MPEQLGKAAEDIDTQQLLSILLASSLLGFGIRGGTGLGRMLGRRATTALTPAPKPFELPDEEEQKLAGIEFEKQSIDEFSKVLLGTGLGAGGFYGGWRLADYLFEKHQIADLESKIKNAKKDYERILLGKPSSLEFRVPKVASYAGTASQVFESGITKESGMDWRHAASFILATMILNSAYTSYRQSRAASPTERRLQALQMTSTRPASIRMSLPAPKPKPKPVSLSATKLPSRIDTKLDESDKIKDPTQKFASMAGVLIAV